MRKDSSNYDFILGCYIDGYTKIIKVHMYNEFTTNPQLSANAITT